MTYKQWFDSHSLKHQSVISTLSAKTKYEIIDYFTYENMRDKHNDFCLLYATNTKCHDIPNLNCYACGCPYFRFDDNGLEVSGNKTVYSICTKGLGSVFESEVAIHHDCSLCEVPHQKKFINDNFDLDWNEMMKMVCLDSN